MDSLTEIEKYQAQVAAVVSYSITKAVAEHRRLYPDGQFRDVNIALGGLRRVAIFLRPETLRMGNEETAAKLLQPQEDQ